MQVVSGTACFQAAATDNVGVTSVTFSVGTTVLGNAILQPTGSWDLAVASSKFPNGTYSLIAKAKDAAGNVGTSAVVHVVVHN